MCCVLAVAALIGPRVAFGLWWLFGTQVEGAFEGSFWLPLGGMIVAPWTSLAWTAAWSPTTGVAGVGFFVVAVGVLGDLLAYAGGARRGELAPGGVT